MLILISASSFSVAQIPLPLSVGGRIFIDNMPVGGVSVLIENLNTGEIRTTSTAFDTPYTKCGYYTVAMAGQDGNLIKVSVIYGEEYSNITIINMEQSTQFCNISISVDEQPQQPPPYFPPPVQPPINPPENNTPIIPVLPSNESSEPEEDETETIVDDLLNLTINVFDNRTNATVGNLLVKVYDVDEEYVTENYTDDYGNATFKLKTGIYFFKVDGNEGWSSYFPVSLLSSSSYSIYLENQTESSGIPGPEPKKEKTSLLVPVGGVLIIVFIIIFVILILKKFSMLEKKEEDNHEKK
jgi:hypothetical protein